MMYKYEIEINARIEEMSNSAYFQRLLREGSFILAEDWFKAGMSPNGRTGFDNHYEITKAGVKRKPGSVVWEPTAPRIESPYIKSDEHFGGLYFIGCVGCNPLTEEYQYCVKIGKSSDIGNRLKQHSGSNPLLYHGNASLRINGDLRIAESNCHRFLDRHAVGMPTGTNEWWFTDKTTYLKMCELFEDEVAFAAIASGKI